MPWARLLDQSRLALPKIRRLVEWSVLCTAPPCLRGMPPGRGLNVKLIANAAVDKGGTVTRCHPGSGTGLGQRHLGGMEAGSGGDPGGVTAR